MVVLLELLVVLLVELVVVLLELLFVLLVLLVVELLVGALQVLLVLSSSTSYNLPVAKKVFFSNSQICHNSFLYNGESHDITQNAERIRKFVQV